MLTDPGNRTGRSYRPGSGAAAYPATCALSTDGLVRSRQVGTGEPSTRPPPSIGSVKRTCTELGPHQLVQVSEAQSLPNSFAEL